MLKYAVHGLWVLALAGCLGWAMLAADAGGVILPLTVGVTVIIAWSTMSVWGAAPTSARAEVRPDERPPHQKMPVPPIVGR